MTRHAARTEGGLILKGGKRVANWDVEAVPSSITKSKTCKKKTGKALRVPFSMKT